MKEFYDCSHDTVFKLLFGNEGSISLLKLVIEEATGIKVDELSLLSEVVPKIKYNVKDMKVDLIAKSNDKVINIELNNSNYLSEVEMKDRNLAYLCSYYGNSLKKDEKYLTLKEHIQINYSFNETDTPLIEEYDAIGKETGLLFSDKFKIYEINFKKLLKKFKEHDSMVLERFKYTLLIGLNKEELDTYCKGDKIMTEFNKKIQELNNDSEFIEYMTYEEDLQKQINTAMYHATEDGIEQGIQQGIEQNKKTNAINLFKNGISKDIICTSLNITMEQLENYLK